MSGDIWLRPDTVVVKIASTVYIGYSIILHEINYKKY